MPTIRKIITFESKLDTNSGAYRLSHVNEQLNAVRSRRSQMMADSADMKIWNKSRSLLYHVQTHVCKGEKLEGREGETVRNVETRARTEIR